MTTARVLGLAICLASTSAFALEQGEALINGFGTVMAAAMASPARPTIPGVATS